MESCIVFQENQTKIYIGKHKLTKSLFGESFIELHLVCNPEESSGYNSLCPKTKKILEKKFVKILTFENFFSLEKVKEEIELNLININFFETGGYLYIKKDF